MVNLYNTIIHAQVSLAWRGQTLLGDIVEAWPIATNDIDTDGADARLVVRFFNGEPWPIEPLLSECTVLERTYEPEEV